jgi:enoyl-CoA hydratase/carnithine racemase
MTTDPHARVHVDVAPRGRGVVAYATVDNASKLNVIGSALMAEFVREMTALGAREDLRAVVLTGAGDRAFIGGASIHEMAGTDAARARGS